MFNKYEEIAIVSNFDNELLADYIQKELNGTIPDRYRKTEKRIVIIKKEEDDDDFLDDNIFLITIIALSISAVIFIIFIIYILKKRSELLEKLYIENIDAKFADN